MNKIKLFAPATIANLNCGFDVLGLCLDGIGDEMTFYKTDETGIKITKIIGADLPFETDKNVAGVAAKALYDAINPDFGIAIEIHKKMKLGSGIGSSSASAAGAVVGVNELLGKPFAREQLVDFAMKGEVVASGSEHADNVAPCLLGNITLVRGYNPLDVIVIKSPDELTAVVLHPHIEVKTSDSRAVLSPQVLLKDAITQTGNIAGFITGIFMEDYELIGRSMVDVLVEPKRKHLIPHFDQVKAAAMANGALGAGISGAGPSIFALCKGLTQATLVGNAMRDAFSDKNITFDLHISAINPNGVTLIS